MAQMTLDKVYPTYADQAQRRAGSGDTLPGSLEVRDGTANIYWSNADTQPANAAAMTLDDRSPITGIFGIVQAAKWVLVSQDVGAPATTVDEYRVIGGQA